MAALNDQVTIEQFTYVSSSQGSDVRTWTTFVTVWVDAEQVTGSENFTSEMDVYSDVKSFQGEWIELNAVTPRMRVKFGSDYYYITSIKNKDNLTTTIIAVRNDDE